MIMTANMGTVSNNGTSKPESKNIKADTLSKDETVKVMVLGEEPPEDDCLKLVKEKKYLTHYQDGYKEGYRRGYVDARKKFS